MASDFVTLRAYFQRPKETVSQPQEAPVEMQQPASDDEAREALHEVRRFRAGLADAAELLIGDVLADIAADVLGRELRIEPAEIPAIVARALDRFAHDAPVRVRLHPDDAARATGLPLPAVRDPGLRRGDVVLELSVGTIDLQMGTRLHDVLAAYGV